MNILASLLTFFLLIAVGVPFALFLVVVAGALLATLAAAASALFVVVVACFAADDVRTELANRRVLRRLKNARASK